MSATGQHHVTHVDPSIVHAVTIEVLQDRNATVAAACFSERDAYGRPIYGTGAAKREPGDIGDYDTAACIAIGRALVSLGQYIIDKAYDEVVD